jgi:hypothetical protein
MKNEQQINGNQSATCPNVLILYDSVASGKRAKELCDRLGKELDREDEPTFSLWNLASLQVAPLAQVALADAAGVALLIVAVNGDDALPPSVKSWISRWGRVARTTGGALVAQLHGIVRMNEELSPAYACLKHIANDEGLDFYSEVVEPSAEESDYSLEAIHERAQMRTSLLEALVQTH